jgi:hypothetical protein
MKWVDDEIEILKKYGTKNELLNLIPGRSWNSIRKKKKKVSPDSIKACKKWSNEEIKIITENYENLDKGTIMNLLPDRTWDSIKLKSNSIGINRSYDFLRESKMEILLEDKLEAFYWIGFILADGHINDNIRLKVTLSSNDFEHLIKFSKYVQCDNIQKDDIKCTITLQNKEMCPKICNKFAIKSDKTYNPPDFNSYIFDKELIFSLIIGFIDGDGHIGKVFKRQDCNLRIHIHKSWLDNLIFIERFLYDYFSVDKDKILSTIGNDGYSSLTISNNKILRKLKKESVKLKLPILERKWNNIDENRKSRNDKSNLIKIYIEKLKSIGLKNSDIIRKLKISKKTFYKYLKTLKKD